MIAQQIPNDFQELPFLQNPFNTPVHRLIVPSKGKHIIVLVEDITCLMGEGNYTYLFVKDGNKYLLSKTLKNFIKMFDPNVFLRVHKSSIINVNFLKEVSVDPDRYVKLQCGREVPISRRKMQEVCEVLGYF